MTQDKANQQLNRELAEMMGYSVHTTPGGYFILLSSDGNYVSGICDEETTAWKMAPDYCVDPAASLEVQAKAIEVDAERYVNKLTTIVGACVFWSSEGSMYPVGITWLMTATPRERAEAAYMTLTQAGGAGE